ncbi:MAG: MFS transporter [Candidatus Tectomicrobia bacterium]|uniref:MFS transporter n=1 Tax=Tectimicrobiota bacterium TaxID=2528274 RepID=A0A932GQA2_UNCTE|nr:MFS transporter [Candidatus Tectomicrobia bacterium]
METQVQDRVIRRIGFTASQWQMIIAMSAAIGLRMLGLFLVLPVFTLYGQQFTDSNFLIGLAFGGYGLTMAIVQYPFGRLSDRYGRKRILIIGMLLFSAGAILAAMPPSIEWLIAARFLQGLGGITSVSFALIADVVQEERRSMAMAFLGIPIGLSFAIGVLLGPIFASLWGYASLFWITGVAGLLSTLHIILVVREPERHIRSAAAPWTPNGEILKLNACGFLMNFFMTSFFFYFPLMVGRYLSLREYYMALGPMVIMAGVSMFAASRIADRGASKAVSFASFSILLFSALVLFQHDQGVLSSHPLAWMIVGGILFFMGFSGLEPVLPALVSRLARRETYGASLGSFNTIQFLGNFAGGAIAGYLGHFSRGYAMGVLVLAAALGMLMISRLQAQ